VTAARVPACPARPAPAVPAPAAVVRAGRVFPVARGPALAPQRMPTVVLVLAARAPVARVPAR
jgi:hypothetical protein